MVGEPKSKRGIELGTGSSGRWLGERCKNHLEFKREAMAELSKQSQSLTNKILVGRALKTDMQEGCGAAGANSLDQ